MRFAHFPFGALKALWKMSVSPRRDAYFAETRAKQSEDLPCVLLARSRKEDVFKICVKNRVATGGRCSPTSRDLVFDTVYFQGASALNAHLRSLFFRGLPCVLLTFIWGREEDVFKLYRRRPQAAGLVSMGGESSGQESGKQSGEQLGNMAGEPSGQESGEQSGEQLGNMAQEDGPRWPKTAKDGPGWPKTFGSCAFGGEAQCAYMVCGNKQKLAT